MSGIRPMVQRKTMRARLDEIMGRVRSKLDLVGDDAERIAERLDPKATQDAFRAFSEADLAGDDV